MIFIEKFPRDNFIYDYKQKWMFAINEATHLHEPSMDSIYRKTLKNIANELYTLIYEPPEQIFVPSTPITNIYSRKYVPLVIENPFYNDKALAGIEELNIFLYISDDIMES